MWIEGNMSINRPGEPEGGWLEDWTQQDSAGLSVRSSTFTSDSRADGQIPDELQEVQLKRRRRKASESLFRPLIF